LLVRHYFKEVKFLQVKVRFGTSFFFWSKSFSFFSSKENNVEAKSQLFLQTWLKVTCKKNLTCLKTKQKKKDFEQSYFFCFFSKTGFCCGALEWSRLFLCLDGIAIQSFFATNGKFT